MASNNIFGSSPEGGMGKSGGQYFIIGRVTSIVLGEYLDDNKTKNPDWTNDGDLGRIDFEILYTGLNMVRANKVSKSAWPIFSFARQYPLINEIVYIVSGPSDQLNDNYKNQKLYYFPPFGVWNAVNHNAFPNMDQYSEFLKYQYQQPGYQGSADVSQTKLPLGVAFQENDKVRSLTPFEGDTLIEGRFGQSIRLGSSNAIRSSKNTWSTNKEASGKPITILINGQGRPSAENSDKFVTTVENISRDDSSIYLTSGQALTSFTVADIKSAKYEFPYKGNQALVCSDRVMLYSKKENVLLYSRQEIGISAIKPVNIYSGENVIVNSPKISLGDETANESIIKGDTFTNELVTFLMNLQTVATHMSKFSESNLGAAAQDMHIAGVYLMNSTARLKDFLSPTSGNKGDHLSKISYVK
jgi:hypothetical protein